MGDLAPRSLPSPLPPRLVEEIERRRAGLARHMTRAVVTLVRWDDAAGPPPQREAIARACEAGVDLFLAAAREARPATPRELRQVAQLGILQARGSKSVEPVLNAYRIAARVAWDGILSAWRGHAEASPEALVLTADYVFSALDQVAAEVTRTFLHAREQHLLRGTRARARLIHSLVSDTFDSELSIQKQALALNVTLPSSYLALVVKSDDGVEDLVSGLDLPARVLADVSDPVTLVVLWPTEDGQEVVEEESRKLLERMTRRGATRLRAGLGGEHPGLRGISRSYLEAQQAVEVGGRLRPEASLHVHDEIAPFMVLAQNPVVAQRYVARVLGRLIEADTKAQLLPTLKAYLGEGSLKGAAATLGLHRHTVLYRLEKLKELIPGGLEDADSQQRIRLAIALSALL